MCPGSVPGTGCQVIPISSRPFSCLLQPTLVHRLDGGISRRLVWGKLLIKYYRIKKRELWIAASLQRIGEQEVQRQPVLRLDTRWSPAEAGTVLGKGLPTTTKAIPSCMVSLSSAGATWDASQRKNFEKGEGWRCSSVGRAHAEHALSFDPQHHMSWEWRHRPIISASGRCKQEDQKPLVIFSYTESSSPAKEHVR